MDITTILTIILNSIFTNHCNEDYSLSNEQREDIERFISLLVGKKIDMDKSQLSELGSVLSGLSKEEISDLVDEHEETVEEFLKLGLTPKL